ncbi:uncharacterized protein conserved in bacteria [Longilinea arvoryzae]|uniref:Uncharacterized protein conserved in bacteria n=1 Tax=Longilinea arvoryzae TaxID=360412 RepID=A0A0S7BFN4_9CHLR|nr:6-hydroxymethylpterin diphosphokinase MptE-like protein [Longilinea arvoryzae]GAP13796.1 uncharacterized protein conserved in bacteria [Longilinea arvoryzae]
MKSMLKKITPQPLWKAGSDCYWGWHNRGRHTFLRGLDPRWRESQQRLESFREKHAGQRCFIMGNGPSLRNTDLSKLRGETTFGLNRIYLAFPELGFSTSYLVAVNDLVLEQCQADFRALSMPKFITWRERKALSGDPNTIFVDTDFTGEENFNGDATGRLFEGFTVTYVALQLAFFMGFKQAILIGVDHNFVTQGPANQAVVSQGDDPNHFTPNYFGAGFKWQLPDLAGSERAYRLARQAYEAAGRSVVDATVGGKLTVFPKTDYLSLF